MAIYARRNDPSRKSALYATRGVAIRQGNWNGTAAAPQLLLCGYKPVNLTDTRSGISIINSSKKGVLMLTRSKNDRYYEDIYEIDFSGAADLTAVTPAEIIAALNTAVPVLTGFTAVFSNAFNCVNLICTDPSVKFTEAFGYLAGALGFGGGEAFTSMGSYFLDFMTNDYTITAAPTAITTDETKAELMGGWRNTRTAVTINGDRAGVQYAVNVKAYTPFIRQLMEGGEVYFGKSLEERDWTYRPVTQSKRAMGKIELYNLVPRHDINGETDVTDDIGLVMEHVWAGTPVLNDDSRGAVSLTSFNFTLTASVYRDANGNEIQQPEEIAYKTNSETINALLNVLENEKLVSKLESEPVTAITPESAKSLPASSIGFNQCSITPLTASGYSVEITEPAVSPLRCQFEWLPEDLRIRILTSNTAGTETVTVKVTNRDGTTATNTFSLTVVAS